MSDYDDDYKYEVPSYMTYMKDHSTIRNYMVIMRQPDGYVYNDMYQDYHKKYVLLYDMQIMHDAIWKVSNDMGMKVFVSGNTNPQHVYFYRLDIINTNKDNLKYLKKIDNEKYTNNVFLRISDELKKILKDDYDTELDKKIYGKMKRGYYPIFTYIEDTFSKDKYNKIKEKLIDTYAKLYNIYLDNQYDIILDWYKRTKTINTIFLLFLILLFPIFLVVDVFSFIIFTFIYPFKRLYYTLKGGSNSTDIITVNKYLIKLLEEDGNKKVKVFTTSAVKVTIRTRKILSIADKTKELLKNKDLILLCSSYMLNKSDKSDLVKARYDNKIMKSKMSKKSKLQINKLENLIDDNIDNVNEIKGKYSYRLRHPHDMTIRKLKLLNAILEVIKTLCPQVYKGLSDDAKNMNKRYIKEKDIKSDMTVKDDVKFLKKYKKRMTNIIEKIK